MGGAKADSTELYELIGERIAQRRAGRGLSQAQLATLIGLTRSSVSNIEKGRQKMLIHTFLDIAHCLVVPPESLLPSAPPTQLRELTFSGSQLSDTERMRISTILEAVE